MILKLDKRKKKKKELLEKKLEQCRMNCNLAMNRIDFRLAKNLEFTSSDLNDILTAIQQTKKEEEITENYFIRIKIKLCKWGVATCKKSIDFLHVATPTSIHLFMKPFIPNHISQPSIPYH